MPKRLEQARVRWFLSIDIAHVPEELRAAGQRTFRAITLDSEAIEFSEGFTDLHTEVYRRTLVGQGFGLQDSHAAIQIVHTIRQAAPLGVQSHSHPFLLV